jgi:hypothetical protein
MSAYVSIRQHTSAYVSEHTSCEPTAGLTFPKTDPDKSLSAPSAHRPCICSKLGTASEVVTRRPAQAYVPAPRPLHLLLLPPPPPSPQTVTPPPPSTRHSARHRHVLRPHTYAAATQRQCLYFCTSKASKLSAKCRFLRPSSHSCCTGAAGSASVLLYQ